MIVLGRLLTCGTQDSTCPQMTADLSGNTDYYVVITTYTAGDPIVLPMEFYVYGEPITVGGSGVGGSVLGAVGGVGQLREWRGLLMPMQV